MMKRSLLMCTLLVSGAAMAGGGCTGHDDAVISRDMSQIGGGAIFGDCAPFPGDESLRILTYWNWADYRKGFRFAKWRVLLAEADRPKVVASVTLNLWEGPHAELREDDYAPQKFHIDRANYPLNATTNAFAIRSDIGREAHCADVARDQFVTLFVRDGDKLKPVLKHLPLQQSLTVEGSGCGRYGYSKVARGEGRLVLLDSETNGYRDLKLETRAVYDIYDEEEDSQEVDESEAGEAPDQPEIRDFETTLKFNGHSYPVVWEELPSKEWWLQ